MNILIYPIDSFIHKSSSNSYEIIPFSINFFQKIKENTCFSLYFLIDDDEKDILECIIKEFLNDNHCLDNKELLTYTIISHSQLQCTNTSTKNKNENWILIGNMNFHNALSTYTKEREEYNNTSESSILNSISNSIKKNQSLNILITNLNPSSQSSFPIKTLSPDYIFETIEQSYKLISYIISSFNHNSNHNHTNNNHNSSLNNVKSLSINYFKNSTKILYMLETKRIKKNYRKREVTISSDLILYIPILYYISMSNSVENLKNIVSSLGIKAFLQRSPEFYFENKEFSFQIQEILIELGVKLVDPFEKLDFLYNRINQLSYLHELKAKLYNSNSEFEFYIPNSCFDGSWVDDSNSNSNSKPIRQVNTLLNYPIIVKREYSGNHNMNILINKSDYFSFIENYKNHNQNLVFQELIPHGGVIGKIYYLNNKTKLVLRNSICVNSYNEEFITESLYKQKAIVYDIDNVFHQRLLNSYKNMTFLCEFIRKNEGISLFNIDFIIHESSLDLYILEINYFPSYNEYEQELQKEFDEYMLSLSIN